MFNHAPTGDDPHLDFLDLLDEDALMIVDTGGLEPPTQQALLRVLLTELWSALRLRHDTTATEDDDLPLVNLYLDEAAMVEDADALGKMLPRGREFGLSVTLAMQFPGQLSEGMEAELLENVSSIIAGQVPDADGLARRLATDDLPPDTVANRLRALDPGDWLVRLPPEYHDETPAPFRVESLPLPPGHPESPDTADDTLRHFDVAMDLVEHHTLTDYGLLVPGATIPRKPDSVTDDSTPRRSIQGDTATPSGAGSAPPDVSQSASEPASPSKSSRDVGQPHGTTRPPSAVDGDPTTPGTTLPAPVKSTFEFTEPPEPVKYLESGMLECAGCGNRFALSGPGIVNTIQCCNSLDIVDREDIPPVAIDCKLTPREIADSQYTRAELAFLKLVRDAQYEHYLPLEYELSQDSMTTLRDYIGIDQTDVQGLIEDDLLRSHGTSPHRLYSVTSDGRHVINDPLVEGTDYGGHVGDLSETSQHRLGTRVGAFYLEDHFVNDSDSPATEVHRYRPLGDQRLDVAAVTDAGTVVAAVEVERQNNDLREAVPSDYDKLASCDPDAAIWIVTSRDCGHDILDALNDPADNVQRVAKTYSKGTPPRQFRIDEPGCTDIYTINNILDRIDDRQPS